MIQGYKAIDTVVNFHFWEPGSEEAKEQLPKWWQDFMNEKIGHGQDPDIAHGMKPAAFLEKLDRAGIEHAFLIAVRSGSRGDLIGRHVPYETVAEVVSKYPDRFSGLAGIDPFDGMKGVAQLEYAVKELGFIGAHLYPHWFGMAPDHAKYYPFYAKCVELDVPIQMQVGHCLRYSAERPLKSVGRPITLDTIACDFPDLKLVGVHIGWPWTEEMIAVAYKHPNVYIGSDAYAPKHWSKEFVHFINTFGSEKVIFGSDFPLIDPERAMKEIEELELRPESLEKFLYGNAAQLYKLSQ